MVRCAIFDISLRITVRIPDKSHKSVHDVMSQFVDRATYVGVNLEGFVTDARFRESKTLHEWEEVNTK